MTSRASPSRRSSGVTAVSMATVSPASVATAQPARGVCVTITSSGPTVTAEPDGSGTGTVPPASTAAAGRRLTTFIDDLSNWYVRRSRRRFWDGPSSSDGAAAFATLYECVTTLTLLLAPFVPFVTDYVWGVLRRGGAPESVHLAAWPSFDGSLVDPELSEQMALARRLVELGRSARSAASLRTRQPLSRALIGAAGFEGLPPELRSLIAAELNVASLFVLSGELVDYVVKPNFRALGRRFGRETPSVAAAIAAVPAVPRPGT